MLTIRQLRVGMMATFCYVVGDEASKTCALIDPAFETSRILRETQHLGYQIKQLINTHGHSDHTGGNADIVAATGARILIHELDANQLGSLLNKTFSRLMGGKGSSPANTLLREGDAITIGESSLRVIHTPGHTPGGICLYTPGHVFTGDTLFVGGVGRTDLPGGSMRLLMKSIQEKLFKLPGNTRVWPGHDYGPVRFSTIAQERQTNPFA